MIRLFLFLVVISSLVLTPVVAQSSLSNPALEQKQPILYPNPATDKLFFNTDFTFQSIEIYDLSGNLRLTVKSFDESFVDISALKPSIYLVKIITSKGVTIAKITVKR